MSGECKEGKVRFDEDDVIQTMVRLDRIKAISDALTTVGRNGYTDELYQPTVHDLMDVIEDQVHQAKALLEY